MLIQERYQGRPWPVLVVSFLLKQTSRRHLRKRIDVFFEHFPTPQVFLDSKEEDIIDVLRPYGLWRKRSKELTLLAQHLVQLGPPASREEVLSMHGAGGYVADSYAIFVLKDFSVEPSDKELLRFLGRKTK